jgi:hypothetical protein
MEPKWSQYKVSFITDFSQYPILFGLADRGYFLQRKSPPYYDGSFTYDPFNDYFSRDMESSYIGYLSGQAPHYYVQYYSEQYFNKVEIFLSNLKLSVSEILNCIANIKAEHKPHPQPRWEGGDNLYLIKRGVTISKTVTSYSVGTHGNPQTFWANGMTIKNYSSKESCEEFVFNGFTEKPKLCRLDLVNVFDHKLGWIPHLKPIIDF